MKEGHYKGNTYKLVPTENNDGRAGFIVNGTMRFFGSLKAAEYFFNLAETNPAAIHW